MNDTTYSVILQAVEPDELQKDPRVKSQAVRYTIVTEADSMGFPEIEAESTNLAALHQFVYDNWVGDGGDVEWYADLFLNRLTLHPAASE